MATTATLNQTHSSDALHAGVWHSGLSLLVSAGLPLGLFGLVHLSAQSLGLAPFYFTPFGLPVWTGAALHLLQLGLVGAAFWAVTQGHRTNTATKWLLALGLMLIALPFITPLLDSLLLAITCTALFLLGAATGLRASKVSPLAGWLLAPVLFVLGFSAALGLAVAAYAPPFALMQTHQAPPAA